MINEINLKAYTKEVTLKYYIFDTIHRYFIAAKPLIEKIDTTGIFHIKGDYYIQIIKNSPKKAIVQVRHLSKNFIQNNNIKIEKI